MIILPPSYAAPVAYYHYLTQKKCVIDVCLNFQRQTFINRCQILTANGLENLSIPIEKPKAKTPIKDIRIDKSSEWQTSHFRALESAYLSSPFFEYFADDFYKIYQTKYDFLIDFLLDIQNTVLECLDYSNSNISFSQRYIDEINSNDSDLRQLFMSKKKTDILPHITQREYYQTFAYKFPFQSNLSVFDMLFNLGREARIFLKG